MLAANTQASNGWNSKNRANKSVDRILPVAAPTTMLARGHEAERHAELEEEQAGEHSRQRAGRVSAGRARDAGDSGEGHEKRGGGHAEGQDEARGAMLEEGLRPPVEPRFAASSVSDTAMMETRYVVSSSDSPCP